MWIISQETAFPLSYLLPEGSGQTTVQDWYGGHPLLTSYLCLAQTGATGHVGSLWPLPDPEDQEAKMGQTGSHIL